MATGDQIKFIAMNLIACRHHDLHPAAGQGRKIDEPLHLALPIKAGTKQPLTLSPPIEPAPRSTLSHRRPP